MNEDGPVKSTRSRRRRWLMAGMTLCLAAGLMMIGGELLLRVYVAARGWTPNCYAAALQLFEPHEERGYELAPNFRLRSGTFDMSTNSRGMRGPEIQRVKPANTRRIAFLGGSSVFGYLVSDGQEAARLVENRLRESRPDVEVINAGVPGYNLFQTIGRYRDKVAPLHPDVVVVYAGFNDLAYVCSDEPAAARFRVRPVPAWSYRMLGRSTLYGFVNFRLIQRPIPWDPMIGDRGAATDAGRAQFLANLRDLAAAVDRSGATLVVCAQALAMHPDADPRLRERSERGAEDFDELVRLGQWLHDALRDFAVEHELAFVDAYAAIDPTPDNFGDFVHLTRSGEQQLAGLLAERLEPLLPDAPPAER